MNYFRFLVFFFGILNSSSLAGQTAFNNGSFEDEPSDATTPHGWYECEPFTTPDIFPGFWGVYTEASEGDTYIGMIYRENNTWESIGQRLTKPLSTDNCYTFSIDLAFSRTYAGYNQPIKLRIWGGTNRCDKGQLIYESPLIDHIDWKTYRIDFNPDKGHTHIILEAFHPGNIKSYKGNILMDNLKPIKICGRV
jgi:hypothetical protein